MRKQTSHPQTQVMVAPPKVPPAAPLVTPKVPAVPEAQVASPNLPKPKVTPQVSTSSKSSKPEKTAKLSSLQLKIETPLTPPVRRLISTAEENLKKGKVLEARAQADRAYRMDLRDPRTSFLMAKVSASEKDYEGAEQWAMRALENLDDGANKAVVWGLIARVREKSGNRIGAAEALKKRNESRR